MKPSRASLLSYLWLPSLCAALLAASCSSTSKSLPPGKTDGPWLVPSPTLQSQIDENAKRMPWTHGVERIQLIQWFAGIGEPAYTTLLKMIADPRPDVAGSAYAALGATRDSRLVEPIRAVPAAASGEDVDVKYERARTLLRLGDYSVVPELIAGLRDDRQFSRALCSQALIEATHENFQFDPRGEEPAREEAVKKWESWWNSRQSDPLISGAKPEQKSDRK
jgi:hypothetical protein